MPWEQPSRRICCLDLYHLTFYATFLALIMYWMQSHITILFTNVFLKPNIGSHAFEFEFLVTVINYGHLDVV